MRILISHRPGGAYGYISDGWINAFRSSGHQVQRWNGLQQMWDAFNPDLYIGCSGHKQPIPKKRRAKVAIHVNPYGPVDLGNINEPEANRAWAISQKPDAVFGYGDENDRILWSYWSTKENIQWVPQPTAADVTIYKPAAEKTHDIVYLGGRWEYKSKTIDAYLLPVLRRLGAKYVVHGWGEWPKDIKFSGRLSEDAAPAFLSSGKIGPCISEPHTHTTGIDIPERVFKVIASGTLAICDPVPGFKRYIPSAVVAQNTDNFVTLCKHYLQHDEEREALARQQLAEVLAAHTYHHRMRALCAAVGLDFDKG